MYDLSQAKRLINECLTEQTTYLDLGNCGLTDLGEVPRLFECTHLETLILSNTWYDFVEKKEKQSQNRGPHNQIVKLTEGFLHLQNLQTLKMGGYYYSFSFIPYINRWHIADYELLSGLTQLKVLDISYTGISDISPLKALNQLNSLDLRSNQISDISPLKDLNQLNSLDLSDTGISDISPLKAVNQLNSLDLSLNKISDISPLKAVNQLNSLDLSNTGISDISPLKALNQLNSLSLSNTGISDISPLKALNQLNSLSLSNTGISDISPLKALNQLNSLDLSGTRISDISPLKAVNQLNVLDLSFTHISDISPLKHLHQLNSLDLSGTRISDISPLKALHQLNSLDLRSNLISDISPLKHLHQLNSLDLSENQISDISPLKALNQLNSLDLSLNKISDISPLKAVNQLNSLDLRSNQISDISPLKAVNQLNSLDLRSNQISDISPLKALNQLNSLSLRSIHISDISPLKHLHQLNSLSLSGTGISDISPLKALNQLNSLDLRSNLISDISPLKALHQLNSLSLFNNQISDISPLKAVNQLNSLDLSYTGISDISPLKALNQLNSLSLFNNQISDISPLKALHQLNSLSLFNNQISDISPLKAVNQLNSLDLRSNQISELPVWITDFKMEITLEEFGKGISLYKNPLQIPPPEIIKQGKEAIIRFFKELEREDVETAQLLEAKVLLLGEGKTGKTSLRYKLEDEDKELPKEEDRTRGVDIYHHEFPIENTKFISHIWDFGGQDVLYQVHRFFLSDDALYILVTDSRFDQGNKFEEWLQTIEIFTNKNDNPIILLQNLKFGDTPASIDISEFRKYYSIVSNKIYEVDLNFTEKKRLEEFREFKKVIEHRLKELPHIQKPILSHWLAVRKDLEQLLKENTHLINFSEYSQICHENKVNNKESQKDLLRYLHRLGIVLWYEDYRAVKQKVILNPEWVTTALYRIIDSQTIRDKNGKLEQQDIEDLWQDAIYVDYHNELLELLRIFRLAYKRKQEDAYIVPSLMNTNIPVTYENWNPTNKWKIRYKYPRLMPRGIVNQLAAELCSYIESDFEDVWAFGVVFSIKNAQAKVQVNRSRKQIIVEAYGNERLALMQAIVKAMEDIHSTYKGLEFDIEIPCNCEKCNESAEEDKTYYAYKEDILREINDNRDDIYCRNLRQTLKIAPILRQSGFALPYKLAELLRGTEEAYRHYKIEYKSDRKKVFVSYSHLDASFLVDIRRHFKPFLSQIDFWDDSKIQPGQKWREEIEKAIRETKVAILLVSTDFFGSEFIQTNELPALLEMAEKEGAVIMLVILKPCLFEEFNHLNQFQALNSPGHPISKMTDHEREEFYVDLVRQTKKILEN
jgi:internalin A